MLFVFNDFCRLVYVLFNSIHNSIPRDGTDLKQRSDLNFNTVTIFMMTNVNVQDWANFRILTNPASGSRSWIVTRHRFSQHKCAVPLLLHQVWWNIVFFRQFSKQTLEHSLDNSWSSDSCSNWCSYSCNKFHRRCSSVRGSAIWDSVGISIVSKRSCPSVIHEVMVSLGTSVHRSATVPWILSWFAEMTVRRIKSTFCSLPLKWTVYLLPALLRNFLFQRVWKHGISDGRFLRIRSSFSRQFCSKSIRLIRISSLPFLLWSRFTRMTYDREDIWEHNSQLRENYFCISLKVFSPIQCRWACRAPWVLFVINHWYTSDLLLVLDQFFSFFEFFSKNSTNDSRRIVKSGHSPDQAELLLEEWYS